MKPTYCHVGGRTVVILLNGTSVECIFLSCDKNHTITLITVLIDLGTHNICITLDYV